jgi:hypothetical protein
MVMMEGLSFGGSEYTELSGLNAETSSSSGYRTGPEGLPDQNPTTYDSS